MSSLADSSQPHINIPEYDPEKMVIEPSRITIGLIYAKWCIHCHHLIPIWNQMVNNIKKKSYQSSPQYIVIEHSNLKNVDEFNNQNSDYLNNERVQHNGFPTLFKIQNGKIDYYYGPKDPYTLEKWFMGNSKYKKNTKKNTKKASRRNRRHSSQKNIHKPGRKRQSKKTK